MQKFNRSLFTAFALAGTLVPLAQATTVNPFDPSEGFNIVVKENFTNTAGHSEGSVALGGVLKFTTNEKLGAEHTSGYKADGVDQPATDLIVGGSVDWANSTGELLVGNKPNGYVKIAGSSTVHAWNPGETLINNSANPNSGARIFTRNDQTEASVKAASNFDFAAKAAAFEKTSAEMAGLTPTQTGATLGLSVQKNLDNFSLTSGLNVFNLTGAEWNNIQNVNWLGGGLMPSEGNGLIFNIDLSGVGDTFNFRTQRFGTQENQNASYMLFNFFNYTGTIIFTGDVLNGAILAPFAHLVQKSTNLNAQIYARSMELIGNEVHYHRNRVTYTPPPPPHSVPDSSATWAGALALVGLVAFRRRMAR